MLKKPLLVAGDIYRPAAVDQLVTLGKQLDVPVYEKEHLQVRKILLKVL